MKDQLSDYLLSNYDANLMLPCMASQINLHLDFIGGDSIICKALPVITAHP